MSRWRLEQSRGSRSSTTGLTGDFTFDFEFAPSDSGLGESSAASVFTAIQEHLGLRLESAKVPVEVIVIDRAEKPTEN